MCCNQSGFIYCLYKYRFAPQFWHRIKSMEFRIKPDHMNPWTTVQLKDTYTFIIFPILNHYCLCYVNITRILSPFCMGVVEKVDARGLELITGSSLFCPSTTALDWIVLLFKDCLPLVSSRALWDMTVSSSRLGGIVSAEHGRKPENDTAIISLISSWRY